jgi:hypothetical protein
VAAYSPHLAEIAVLRCVGEDFHWNPYIIAHHFISPSLSDRGGWRPVGLLFRAVVSYGLSHNE